MTAQRGRWRSACFARSSHFRLAAIATHCRRSRCASTTSRQLVPIEPVEPKTAICFMPERFAQKRGLTPYHLDVRDCEQRVRGLSPFWAKRCQTLASKLQFPKVLTANRRRRDPILGRPHKARKVRFCQRFLPKNGD